MDLLEDQLGKQVGAEGLPPDINTSAVFEKGVAAEVRRQTARADLREIADILEGRGGEDVSKKELQAKFAEAVINLGGGENLLAAILSARMNLARALQLIPPEAGTMNLASFLASEGYASVRVAELPGMPKEAQLIESVSSLLFGNPGKALSPIVRAQEEMREQLEKMRIPADSKAEIHEIQEGDLSIQFVNRLEIDRRKAFVDPHHPDPTTLAAISVDGWLKFCEKRGWLEGLDPKPSRTGPHGFIIKNDGARKRVIASTYMPGIENCRDWLSLKKEFNWLVQSSAKANIEKMLRRQGFDTSALDHLEIETLRVNDLVHAINECKRIDAAGIETPIVNDEWLRLLLSEANLPCAFQTIRYFSKLRKPMGIDGTFAVTEFYPFGWLLEIAQLEYRRQTQSDLLCYEVLSEKFIDDGRDEAKRLPTDVIYTSVPDAESAFSCVDPGRAEKILTSMFVMDAQAPRLPMWAARERIQRLYCKL